MPKPALYKPSAGPEGPQPGLLERGNIDLTKRPVVRGADGSIATVRSITIEKDGKQVLIPTVVGGKIVSNQDAVKRYKDSGEHLGVFDNDANAESYAVKLHQAQAKYYGSGD